MNAAYLEKPLADIVLSHDIVVRKTYSLASVTIRSILISLHSLGRYDSFKFQIFHKNSFIYLVVSRKNTIFVALIPGSL